MERIGMRRSSADDFVHPLARREELRPYVLYRLSAEDWASAQGEREAVDGAHLP
jgi:hypothetical protein